MSLWQQFLSARPLDTEKNQCFLFSYRGVAVRGCGCLAGAVQGSTELALTPLLSLCCVLGASAQQVQLSQLHRKVGESQLLQITLTTPGSCCWYTCFTEKCLISSRLVPCWKLLTHLETCHTTWLYVQLTLPLTILLAFYKNPALVGKSASFQCPCFPPGISLDHIIYMRRDGLLLPCLSLCFLTLHCYISAHGDYGLFCKVKTCWYLVLPK